MQYLNSSTEQNSNLFVEWLNLWPHNDNQTHVSALLFGGSIMHLGGFGNVIEEDSDDSVSTMVTAPEEPPSTKTPVRELDDCTSTIVAVLENPLHVKGKELSDSVSSIATSEVPPRLLALPTKEVANSVAILTESGDPSPTVIAVPKLKDSALAIATTLKSSPPYPISLPELKEFASPTDTDLEGSPSVARTELFDSASVPVATPVTGPSIGVLPPTKLANSATTDLAEFIPIPSITNIIFLRPPTSLELRKTCYFLLSQAACYSRVYAGILGRRLISLVRLVRSAPWECPRAIQVLPEQIIFSVFMVLGFIGSLGWFRVISVMGQRAG